MSTNTSVIKILKRDDPIKNNENCYESEKGEIRIEHKVKRNQVDKSFGQREFEYDLVRRRIFKDECVHVNINSLCANELSNEEFGCSHLNFESSPKRNVCDTSKSCDYEVNTIVILRMQCKLSNLIDKINQTKTFTDKISIKLINTLQNYLKKAKHKLITNKGIIKPGMSSDEEIVFRNKALSANNKKINTKSNTNSRRGRRTDDDKLKSYYNHQSIVTHVNEECNTCTYIIGKYGDSLVRDNKENKSEKKSLKIESIKESKAANVVIDNENTNNIINSEAYSDAELISKNNRNRSCDNLSKIRANIKTSIPISKYFTNKANQSRPSSSNNINNASLVGRTNLDAGTKENSEKGDKMTLTTLSSLNLGRQDTLTNYASGQLHAAITFDNYASPNSNDSSSASLGSNSANPNNNLYYAVDSNLDSNLSKTLSNGFSTMQSTENSDHEIIDLQVEALALNKTIKFTGDKLHEYISKTTAELTGIVNQAIEGIYVKSIVITQTNNICILTIVAFDTADYAFLKQKDWQKKTFGGIKELKQPVKLYVHVMVNKNLNIDEEKIKAELKLQGVGSLIKDKDSKNGRNTRAKAEVNTVEEWFLILNGGLRINGVPHSTKEWRFTPKYCTNCLEFGHYENVSNQELKCTKEKRCAVDGRIHKSTNDCQSVTRCFNCNRTDHRSGSIECQVYKKEIEFCNRKYSQMLGLKPLKRTKYNIRVNNAEQFSLSKSSSVASFDSAASAASSSQRKSTLGDDTILNLIHKLEKGQSDLNGRINNVESKLADVQDKMAEIGSSVEQAIERKLSTLREDNAELIKNTIKAFVESQKL